MHSAGRDSGMSRRATPIRLSAIPVGQIKVVTTVDAGGEYDIGDCPATLCRQLRRQDQFRRAIADHPRMVR